MPGECSDKASATRPLLASPHSRHRARAATFGAPMDAAQALAELTEISSQIKLALIFDLRGELIEATLSDRERAAALAFGAAALLACTTQIAGHERDEPIQVELAYAEGSVLLVREGYLRIFALTTPDPIAGLAFFELRACLRKLDDTAPKRRLRGIGRALKTAITKQNSGTSEATSPGGGEGAGDDAQ